MTVEKIDLNRIPTHIAIILDGNGRWAKSHGLPRSLGHRKGAYNLRDIASECNKLKIKYLSVFCFSTENWNRPKDEVDYLMTAPIRYLKKYYDKIANSTIRIKVIGRRDNFSKEFLNAIELLESSTKNHTGLTLALYIDYGSYDEISSAVKEIAENYKSGKMELNDINSTLISSHLFTKDFPPLDLLIRTSGEYRISNFLLWQLAYSELYFSNTLWPDFNKFELEKAIVNFQSRDRRFGGLKEEKK